MSHLKESRVFKMHISCDDVRIDNAQWRNVDNLHEYLKKDVIEAMPRLKEDLNKCFDDGIDEVKVLATYDGSLFVFFKVIWDYAKIALDAYDICNMIRDISERFFYQKLKGKYGDSIRVDTHYYGEDNLYKRKMYTRQPEYRDAKDDAQLSECSSDANKMKLDIKFGENGKIRQIKIQGAISAKDLLHLVSEIKDTFRN